MDKKCVLRPILSRIIRDSHLLISQSPRWKEGAQYMVLLDRIQRSLNSKINRSYLEQLAKLDVENRILEGLDNEHRDIFIDKWIGLLKADEIASLIRYDSVRMLCHFDDTFDAELERIRKQHGISIYLFCSVNRFLSTHENIILLGALRLNRVDIVSQMSAESIEHLAPAILPRYLRDGGMTKKPNVSLDLFMTSIKINLQDSPSFTDIEKVWLLLHYPQRIIK